MRSTLAALAVIVPLLVPGASSARSVYLNKVRIDDASGLRNLKLEKVSVRIDERGDIHIDAPGYQIKVLDPGGPSDSSGGGSGPITSDTTGGTPRPSDPVVTGEPRLTQRYFLVTEQTVQGATGFDVDVYVNAKWIRKLKNGDPQIYLEITKHLVPGRNTVLLNARKQEAGRSSSSEHTYRVIIGEGNVGGDHVMIDRPVIDFKRTAADQENVSKEFSFVTR